MRSRQPVKKSVSLRMDFARHINDAADVSSPCGKGSILQRFQLPYQIRPLSSERQSSTRNPTRTNPGSNISANCPYTNCNRLDNYRRRQFGIGLAQVLQMDAYYSTMEWIESLPFGVAFTRTELYIEMRWRHAYRPRSKGAMNLAVQKCLRDNQIIEIAPDRWMRI